MTASKGTGRGKSDGNARAGLLVARTPFLAPGGRIVPKGTVVQATDPLVKGRENLFQSVDDLYRDTRAD